MEHLFDKMTVQHYSFSKHLRHYEGWDIVALTSRYASEGAIAKGRTVIIRTVANEKEVEQAIEIYWADTPPMNPSDRASALTHWLAIYASCPEGFLIVVEENTQQIVGVVSAIRRPPQWLLVNFYVLPAYHGRGIGRLLLSHVLTVREGCERFAVHASRHPSAQGLYMQFGMYPQPYSIQFRGSPKNHPFSPSPLEAEDRSIAEILSILNALDREGLGFTRAMDHQRWADNGKYYVVKAEGKVVGYFRASLDGILGPLVVSEVRWMTAALDLAIDKQMEISKEPHEVLVPGANTSALSHLLARGYHYQDLDLLLSSHPMPSLAQVVFHDMDFL